MSGGGGQEVYCCDEHGRPYVIRTIDGIRKPIAITSSFLRHILKNVKDSSEKKLIDRLLKAMEAGRANLKSFFSTCQFLSTLNVGVYFLILMRHRAHLDPPETPPSGSMEQAKINKGREPKTDI